MFASEAIRYDRAQLSASLDDPTSDAGYVIGTFALSPSGVVDGDTIKVDGLDASLRLLAIDTEETFKHENELRAYESLSFPEYLESMRGESGRPPKGPTPLGMDAKVFAKEFFKGIRSVRLERDHPKEIRGRYNRYLAYVFVEKDGEWVNYNVECVRAGMTPYFTKYGYSRRFHDEFLQAQEEAQRKQVGIWEPGKEHYTDYDDRLTWWDSRAEFAAQFEQAAEGQPDHVVLTNWDAMSRLADMRGEWVKVLGVVGEVKPRKGRAPARILLGRRMFEDFPIIAFDDDVVADSGVAESAGEFIVIEGYVSRYTYKSGSKRRGERSQLQIELKNPDQIRRSPGWKGRNKQPTLDPVAEPEPIEEPEPVDSPPPAPNDPAADSVKTPPSADEPATPPPPADDPKPDSVSGTLVPATPPPPPPPV